MRTRSSGSFNFTDIIVTTTMCGGSPTVATYSSPYWKQGTVSVCEDEVVPQFFLRQRQGGVYNNPCTITKSTWNWASNGAGIQRVGSCPGGAVQSQTQNVYVQPFGSSAPESPLISSPDVESWKTSAATQAKAGVGSPDVQGLVELAEAKKTLTGLLGPLKNMQSQLDEIRGSSRFRRSRYVRVADFLANSWLWYRYGIRPTVRSIFDIMEAFQKEITEEVRFRSKSGGYGDTDVVSGSETDGGNFIVTRSWTKTHSLQVRAGILYEMDLQANTFGVSLQDLPLALWELIPYSFVADWFLNVGDYISAITPKAGTRELTSWTVIRETLTTNVTHSAAWSGLASYQPTTFPDGSASCEITKYTRIPTIGIGLALQTAPFGWLGDPNVQRVVDAVSLITQQLLPSGHPRLRGKR
jgi:hypothetical protein